MLLLEHRYRVPWAWGLPGGFVTHGESLTEALGRELREELGLALEIEPGPFDVELSPRTRNLTVTHLARPAGELDALRPDGIEVTGGGFFGPEALPPNLYPRHEALLRRFWAERPPGA